MFCLCYFLCFRENFETLQNQTLLWGGWPNATIVNWVQTKNCLKRPFVISVSLTVIAAKAWLNQTERVGKWQSTSYSANLQQSPPEREQQWGKNTDVLKGSIKVYRKSARLFWVAIQLCVALEFCFVIGTLCSIRVLWTATTQETHRDNVGSLPGWRISCFGVSSGTLCTHCAFALCSSATFYITSGMAYATHWKQ